MIFNRAMTFYKIIYKNTSIPFLLTKNDLLFDFIKKNIFVWFKEKFLDFKKLSWCIKRDFKFIAFIFKVF